MDARELISSEIVEGALFSESGVTSAEQLRAVLEEVQARYYDAALGAGVPDSMDPDDLAFLENAAFHLVNVVTRRDASFDERDWSMALGTAGLLFELLGRTAEGHRQREFFVNAALANSLAGVPANSSVLLRDAVGDPGSDSYSLRSEYDRRGGPVGIAVFTILVLLARGLRAITAESSWLIGELRAREERIQESLNDGRIREHEYHAALAYQRLAQASIRTATFMMTGEEDLQAAADKLIESGLSLAFESRDVEAFWVARMFDRARDRMVSNSIWMQLRGHLPDSYLVVLANASNSVVELWPPQVQALCATDEGSIALEGGFLNSAYKRVFISMPTSSGKSLLAELAAVKELFAEDRRGANVIYVVPSRALVNEVVDRLSDRLFDLGVAVRRVVSGYDSDPFDLTVFAGVSQSVFVMTQEKLSLLLHQNSEVIEECSLFVFDEVHNISDGARGWTLESALSWLSNLKPETRNRKMVFMSAAIDVSVNFVDWLTDERTLRHLIVSSHWRPTRQVWALCDFPSHGSYSSWRQNAEADDEREWEAFGRLTYVDAAEVDSDFKAHKIEDIVHTRQTVRWDIKQRRYRIATNRSTSQENHAAQLSAKLSRLGPVLVYFPLVDSLTKFVRELGPMMDQLPGEPVPEELTLFLQDRLHPEYALCKWLDRGVAFHHGRLPLDVRAELERQYRQGHIRVLASTTTLAEGVNLPTRTLVVAGTKFGGWSEDELSVQKFRNMLGRAGRALRETEGMAIFLESPIKSGKQGTGWRDYFFPSPEDLSPRSFIADLPETQYSAFFKLLNRVSEAEELEHIDDDKIPDLSRQARTGVADAARRIQAFLLAMDAYGLLGEKESDLDQRLTELIGKTYIGRLADGEAVESLRKYASRSTTLIRKSLDRGEIELVAKTGLSPKSSHALLQVTAELWRARSNWPSDPASLAEFVLSRVLEAGIPEAKPPMIRRGLGNSRPITIDHVEACIAWTFRSVGARGLADSYFGEIKDCDLRVDRTFRYVEEMFEYRLPWVLSAVHSLLVEQGKRSLTPFKWDDAQFHLSVLPALLRFGVDSAVAALFSSLGVSSARASRFLARRYISEGGNERDFREMYHWVMSQNGIDLEQDETVTALELKRAFAQLSRLQMRTAQLLRREKITCYVAGWRYYQGDRIMDSLTPGTELTLRPDPTNEFDSNAIGVYFTDQQVGHVPMRLSREIGLELRRGEVRCSVVSADRARMPWERAEIVIQLPS